MLKIAKSVEYAVMALRFISESNGKNCVSAKEISEKEDIPFELLAKILQKLVKSDIIASVQGNKGGYNLKIPPENLSIFDIVNALGQKIQLTDCMVEEPSASDCGRLNNCCLRGPMSKMQSRIENLFNETKLIELIQ